MSVIKGAFSQNGLNHLFDRGRLVKNEFFDIKHIGPASVDLTITSEIYEVEEILLPKKGQTIREMLSGVRKKPIAIGDVLYPKRKYVALASVGFNFPAGLYGYANAKSTSGRNFILVNTIADYCISYNTVDNRDTGFSGEIWLVIEPLVYPIIATPHECYSQLRVFNGDTRLSKKEQLRYFLQSNDLLYRTSGSPYKHGELSLETHSGTFLMTLEAEADGVIGYRAKNTEYVLDLEGRNIDPKNFFEPVFAECYQGASFVRLEPGEYYLLTTHEQIKIPETHCAEMKAIDPRLGLFFSHFAGFFDPGFFGTATLEVMSPIGECVRHGHPVAAFELECMQEATVSYAQAGNYAGQIGTRLPKQFKNFTL